MDMKVTQEEASAVFDEFMKRPDWEGFGYLGARRGAREVVAEGDWPAETLVRLTELDQALVTVLGSGERAFEWANSADGRRFADRAFSNDLPALDVVCKWNHKWGGKLWKMGYRIPVKEAR